MSYSIAPPPIPASFNFAGNFAQSLFCFNNPLNPLGPTLVVGWANLVTAFSVAMSSEVGQGAGFSDMSFASNWLTQRAYTSWRWSSPASAGGFQPVFVRIPFYVPNGPNQAGALEITRMTTTFQQAQAAFYNLGANANILGAYWGGGGG